jgi:ABC-type Fe3+-siderophore transport system permease subunit
LIAYEGSSLTLVGLVSYNPETNKFSMTDVLGFVGGGAKECFRMVEEQVSQWRMGRNLAAFVAGTLISVAVIMLYQKLRNRSLIRHV